MHNSAQTSQSAVAEIVTDPLPISAGGWIVVNSMTSSPYA